MGWAGGSEVFSECWKLVRKHVPDKEKPKVIKKLIELFENQDCDTIDEVADEFPEVRKVYDKMYPPEDDDYGDDD